MNIIYTSLLLTFLIKMYSIFYPDEYNKKFHELKDKIQTIFVNYQPLFVNIGYSSIYYYSYCQIQINKIKKYITPYCSLYTKIIGTSFNDFLKRNNLVFYPFIFYPCTEKNKLTFFKNGTNVKEIPYIDNFIINDIPANYDFIEISDYSSDNNNFVNKICMVSIPSIEKIKYELSNIKFMSICLIYNEKKYDIYLSTEKYNYYIVGNVIDQIFLRYYLINILNEQSNAIPDDFQYKLEVLDQNVNMITLTNIDSIVFNKDNYELIKRENILQTNTNTSRNSLSKESDDYVNLDISN